MRSNSCSSSSLNGVGRQIASLELGDLNVDAVTGFLQHTPARAIPAGLHKMKELTTM
jgi:hypothetical protein